MNTQKTCFSCKKTLDANAPDGLCPECLLQAGLGTGAAMGPDSQADSGRVPFAAPSVEEMVRLFPQLEILGFIGQGGMGAVYKARQKVLDRVVALKILPPGIGGDASFAQRFTREARALARLNHPGVVTLYEFGQAGGLFYFLMEYVDGVSLRHLLEAGRISPREALTIVPQICDALQFAHDLGFVHRDIKPENILMDRRGRVKVADFGVAKLMGAEILAARRGDDRFPEAAGKSPLSAANENAAEGTPSIGDLTGAGKVLGTPQYMAPEQRDNPTEVDHRADIYALGVVFYQLLTGELPGKRLEPPSAKVQIDVRLDDVVLRALERTPQRRYQQASQVKTDVEAIAASPQLTDRGPRADPPPDRTPRMSRTAIAGACWAALFVIPVVELFMLRTLSPSEFGSSPFRWVLSFLDQRLLSLTAPFGTTILGWIAVARIRRSAGRLCGLRLAVFDGLLFPLLAMDALFFWLFWVESNLGILLPLTLLTVIPLNWLIAQRVWRAVKTSSAAGGE